MHPYDHAPGCPGGLGFVESKCVCGVYAAKQLRSQASDQVLVARMAVSQARVGGLVEGMSRLAGEEANDLGDALRMRPPLGLRPRHCVGRDESPRYRYREIAEAIGRYAKASRDVPAEWLTELIEVNGKVADLNGGGRHDPG